MGVVIAVVLVLVVVLVWAVYADQTEAQPDRIPLPEWEAFPDADDIRRPAFPLAPMGYDRDAVDRHLQRVADAFDTALTARDVVEAHNHRDAQGEDRSEGSPDGRMGDG